MNKETLVIGDIHGSYEYLKKMLEMVKYEPNKYKIVFLGDYVDRGNCTKQVIDLLIDIKSQNEETVFLLGNHDDWFINFLESNLSSDEIGMWYTQGGFETLESYYPDFSEENKSLRDIKEYILKTYPNHVNFFKNLKLYHEDDNFYYAHGGCNPYIKNISDNSKEELIWPNRNHFFNTETGLNKPIVIGHTVVKHLHGKLEPYVTEDKIGIDGGIVFGHVFIAMIIDDETGRYDFEILSP